MMGTRVSQLSRSRSYDSRLFRAIERNDMTTVKYLVEKHIDINRIENGHTPLNLALHRRNTEIVKMLLDEGMMTSFALLSCLCRKRSCRSVQNVHRIRFRIRSYLHHRNFRVVY